MRKSFLTGLTGPLALLGVYFSLVTALSGWEFALSQFLRYWYWLAAVVFISSRPARLWRGRTGQTARDV